MPTVTTEVDKKEAEFAKSLVIFDISVDNRMVLLDWKLREDHQVKYLEWKRKAYLLNWEDLCAIKTFVESNSNKWYYLFMDLWNTITVFWFLLDVVSQNIVHADSALKISFGNELQERNKLSSAKLWI